MTDAEDAYLKSLAPLVKDVNDPLVKDVND